MNKQKENTLTLNKNVIEHGNTELIILKHIGYTSIWDDLERPPMVGYCDGASLHFVHLILLSYAIGFGKKLRAVLYPILLYALPDSSQPCAPNPFRNV